MPPTEPEAERPSPRADYSAFIEALQAMRARTKRPTHPMAAPQARTALAPIGHMIRSPITIPHRCRSPVASDKSDRISGRISGVRQLASVGIAVKDRKDPDHEHRDGKRAAARTAR